MGTATKALSAGKTWMLVFWLLLLILLKGFLALYIVGDRGQPAWDYRPVSDVPGESPYAVYDVMPFPQHVRGAEGE